MHNVLSAISSEIQWLLTSGTVWKPSSSSRYSRVLVGVALGVGGVLAGVLSSSVELNESCLHTGLDGVHGMFCGVTCSGSNEACPMLEIWWILIVFLSWVGKLMVS